MSSDEHRFTAGDLWSPEARERLRQRRGPTAGTALMTSGAGMLVLGDTVLPWASDGGGSRYAFVSVPGVLLLVLASVIVIAAQLNAAAHRGVAGIAASAIAITIIIGQVGWLAASSRWHASFAVPVASVGALIAFGGSIADLSLHELHTATRNQRVST